MPRPRPTTRVLILSDTHGRVHPAIVRLARGVGHIVHAGDIGDPAVLRQLAANGARVVAVLGNNDAHDGWPDDDAAAGTSPDRARLALPGGVLAVEHGHRVNPVAERHARLRDRHRDARLVVYGHSHRQCIDDRCRPVVVNPGAAGRTRTFGGSGCILLTAGETDWSLRAHQFPLATWNA